MIELSVENLHLTYGDNPVLKGVSMELKRGEVVSLLGPSGSGKTTLLRAVAGLEKPTQGRITIGSNIVYDGTPRSEIPAEERNLGLVFQSYALWPHKTVFENVAYPLKLRKVPLQKSPNVRKRCSINWGWGTGQAPSAPAFRGAAAACRHWPCAGL